MGHDSPDMLTLIWNHCTLSGRASLDELSEQIANSKGRKKKDVTTGTPTRPKQTPNRRRKVPTKTRTIASKILKSARDRSAGKKKAAATGNIFFIDDYGSVVV